MSTGGEQFAPIPIRAFGDTRLSANDFRVLSVIAYHDRFSRNGIGCTVDPRKLADLVKVDRSHWPRHTSRLERLGYVKVTRSQKDRRKKHYSVNYSDPGIDDATSKPQMSTSEVSGDREANAPDLHGGYKPPRAHEEELTTSGEKPHEKVANDFGQNSENNEEYSNHKKSRKTESKKSREAAIAVSSRSSGMRTCRPMARQKEQHLEWCGFGRGFNMEAVISLLSPLVPRSRASEFIMEAIDEAQSSGLSIERAGDAVAKAVKGWQTKGFPPKRFPALLHWAIDKCRPD